MCETPNQGEFEALKDAYDAMLGANAATIAGHREWEKERKDVEARKEQAQRREVQELTSKIELLNRKVNLLEEQNREQRRALGEEEEAHENMRSEWQLKEELVATQRMQEGEISPCYRKGLPSYFPRVCYLLPVSFCTCAPAH